MFVSHCIGFITRAVMFWEPLLFLLLHSKFRTLPPGVKQKIGSEKRKNQTKNHQSLITAAAIATLLYYVVFQAQMMMIADFTLDCFQFFLPLSRGGGETESHKESLGWWLLVGKNYENIYLFSIQKGQRGGYSTAGASRVVHDKIVCLPPFLKRSVLVDNSYSRELTTTIALESNTLFSKPFFLPFFSFSVM